MKLYNNQHCPMCGSAFHPNLYAQIQECEYDTVEDVFSIHRCEQCDTLIMDPRPTEADLDIIYPDNYYAHAPDEGKQKSVFQQMIAGLFKKVRINGVQNSILKHVDIPSDRPLRVLDIGCGVGIELDVIKEAYPDADTWGVDFSDAAIDVVRKHGHNGLVGRVEELELPADYFDLVLSMHVIEHVGEPDQFVAEAIKLLSPGGTLVLATPNTDCVDFNLFGRRHWGGYHTPRHWYLFRHKSFAALAERLHVHLIETIPYTLSSFWVVTFHSLSKQVIGKKFADVVFPPVKVLSGGFYAFFLLSFFAVLERGIKAVTGKGNAMWVILRK